MNFDNINFNFENKIVLVNGGSRGIGNGAVKAFLKAGAKVLYLSRQSSIEQVTSKAKHISIDFIG